jgi:hypothetical protein
MAGVPVLPVLIMKTAWFACLAPLVLSGAAYAQRALPIAIGPRLSVELHDSHLVIGVEARFGVAQIAPTVRLDIRPSFDYYLYSGGHIIGIAGDALFAIDVRSDTVEPYAGAGLGFFSLGCSGCEGISRIGLNLLGGVKFVPRGTVQPFVELRFTVGDIDPILLTGGVLFIL